MTTARTSSELRALFADQAYMHTRVPADGYLYEGYLADLNAYWDDAERRARAQIAAGEAPDAFAECLRAALIRTSINSVARNYSTEKVVWAVQLGLWSPERALDVALRVPYIPHRAEMLVALLRHIQLSETQKVIVETEVLAYTSERRRGGREYVMGEVGIMPYLSSDELLQDLVTPRVTTDLIYVNYIINRQLKHYLLDAIFRELPNDFYVPENEDYYALLAAKSAAIAESRKYLAYIISGFDRDLSSEQRISLLIEALVSFPKINQNDHFAFWETIISQLSDVEHTISLVNAFTTAILSMKVVDLVKHLEIFAPHFPQNLFNHLVVAFREIKDRNDSVTLLCAISEFLPEAEHSLILTEAIMMAHTSDNDFSRPKLMIKISWKLPQTARNLLIAELLLHINNWADDRMRVDILEQLSPDLPYYLVEDMLLLAREIENPYQRFEALMIVLPRLPVVEHPELLGEIVSTAREMRDVISRSKAFHDTFNYLTEIKLPLVLKDFRTEILELLRGTEVITRADLLMMCKTLLLPPPVLSPECLAECARHIFEITTQWEWL